MSINLNRLNDHSAAVPRGATPATSSKTKGENLWNRDIKLWGGKLSAKQKMELYAESAILLRAGLDIRKSLELQRDNSSQAIQRQTYDQLLQSLLAGYSLAAAMEHTQQFSAYELAGVRIAEESGQLPPILDRLTNHFAKIVKLNRLLLSTLSYPVLVITVAAGALIFLVTFLVPLFSDIYARLDQELPAVTGMIIAFSEWLQAYLLISVLIISTISGLLYWLREKTVLRSLFSKLLLRFPVIGPTYHKIQLSKFCHSLGFLLEANIPLVEGLRLTEDMITFFPIQLSLPLITSDVISGRQFNASLQMHQIYPRKLVALTKVGEEANQLGPLLSQLGNTYDEEVEQQTKLLGSLIEPILIVFLALVIGVVLVAMYLPIFKLVTNFGV